MVEEKTQAALDAQALLHDAACMTGNGGQCADARLGPVPAAG